MEIIIASLVPSIIYLFIFKVLTPHKSWKLSRAFSYMFFGVASPLLLILLYDLFPFISELYLISSKITTQLLLLSFIQIAFIEEVVKYICFIVYNKAYDKLKHEDKHPLAIMFYTGSVSLGFAFIENIKYGMEYGLENVYWRSVTSVLMHLSFGMMMGYWISLSKFNFNFILNPVRNINGISTFELFMRKNPRIRVVFYTFLGIFTATFFHGLYDLNFLAVYNFTRNQSEINSTWTIQLIIMGFSFYIVKVMSDHLIRLYNKKIHK